MSNTAEQYPVTFPYGATDGMFYFKPTPIMLAGAQWIGPYHRGDDHVMPDGTPIPVNGVIVGLSGHSGRTSAPHLHIGKFVGSKDTDPQGGGFDLKPPVRVYDTGMDAINGSWVKLLDGDGVLWCYLHLSAIKVSKGYVLPPKKEKEMPTPVTNETFYILMDHVQPNTPADQLEQGRAWWVDGGRSLEDLVKGIPNAPLSIAYRKKAEVTKDMVDKLWPIIQGTPPADYWWAGKHPYDMLMGVFDAPDVQAYQTKVRIAVKVVEALKAGDLIRVTINDKEIQL